MKSKRLVRAALFLCTGVSIVGGLDAATQNRESLESLTARAELIVHGQCTRATSQWIDRTLVTLFTVSVDETLKGDWKEEVTVVIPGGIDTDRHPPIAVTVPGAPRIDVNEEVVLFLGELDSIADSHALVDFSRGKISVNREAAGRRIVESGREKVSLAGFKDRIRSILNEDRAQ